MRNHSFILKIMIIGFMATSQAMAEEKKNVLDLPIASTPVEFRCEAFDPTTFDQVNESMNSLKKTLNETFGINDKCVTTKMSTPENQKHLSTLIDNIKGGVSTLRGQIGNSYIENLSTISSGSITTQQAYEMTAQGQEKAREAVVTVVGAIKELNAIIAKNPLNISSANSCKTHYSPSERFVFGVAELIEDVSPLLIQAVSKIPGLQELAPAVIGATMVSSAINSYAEVAQKRIDINKPENRTAILINTCQLAKTYNRMKMLRNLQDNSIEEKQKLKKMITEQSNLVIETMSFKKGSGASGHNDRNWISSVEQQDRNYMALRSLQEKLRQSDLNGICERKNDVQSLSSSIQSIHQTVAELAGSHNDLLGKVLQSQIQQSESLLNDKSLSPYECAKSVRSLFEYSASLNEKTFQIIMDSKMAKMAQDPDFVRASAHLDFLTSFQDLLEQMGTDDLFQKLQISIDKTDSMIQQSQVLKAWFGNAKPFYMPWDDYRNPVMDLMYHYERQFEVFRKDYMVESATFEHQLYQLYSYYYPRQKGQSEKEHIELFNMNIRGDLKILTPTYLNSSVPGAVSGRSSPHERACTGLIAMRNNYRRMIDSWSTLKYFCQMIQPLMLEPEISKDLKNRCMAQDQLVPGSPKAKLSGVDALLSPVSKDVQRMPIVIDKIKELGCEN